MPKSIDLLQANPNPAGLSSVQEKRPGHASQNASFVDMRRVLFKRKYLVLAVTVAALIVSYIYAKTRVPMYDASATAEIDSSRSQTLGLSDALGGGLDSGSSELQTDVFRLNGDSLIFRAVAELGTDHLGPFPHAFDGIAPPITEESVPPEKRSAIVGAVHGGLSISVIPKTNAVKLTYRHTDYRVARDFVNKLLQVFMDRSVEDRLYGTAQATKMLGPQMEELRNHAADAQRNLVRYQEQHSFIGTDEKDNLTTAGLKITNQQLAEAQADELIKQARLQLVDSATPESLVSVAPTPTLQALRSQEVQVRAELSQLTSKYGPGYPRVHELQSQLPGLDRQIAAEANNVKRRVREEYETSSGTVRALRGQLQNQMQQAYKLNEGAAQYALLREDAESSRDLYDVLQLKLKESSVTAALSASSISVIDHAVLKPVPVEPNRRRIMTSGTLAGIILAIFMAFGLEALDDTLQTSEDVENSSNFNSLGAIPHFDPQFNESKEPLVAGAYQVPSRLVTITAPDSLAAEAFRGIRSGILLSSVDVSKKVILVTSSYMSEGKSTLSANLAIALAQRGARVLLVDTDLRRSTLHKIFALKQQLSGLSNLLGHIDEGDPYIHPVPAVPSLTFLPAGVKVPNPAELLASARMAELVAEWEQNYDHVVIDSAPILMVSDSLSIAALADGVVIVVRSGLTRKKALLRSFELLSRSQAKILGAVVNDVDLHLENFYTYSNRGYGYRYSGYKGYGVAYGDDHREDSRKK